MPFEDNKTIKFIQYKKSDEAPFITYADLECMKRLMDVKTIVKIILKKSRNKKN